MTLAVISGAASGVEQGAIEAAVNLALHWQGWASSESILTVAPVYRTGLQPTSAVDPGMVRRLNIQGADGALVFSTSMVTAGVAAFVDRWTERMGRAFLHVTLNPAVFGLGGGVWTRVDGTKVDRRVISDEVAAHVQEWIRKWDLARVYVTGPSADDVPGIQGATRDALLAILEPFAVDEVRETTRMMGLVEQAAAVRAPLCTCVNPPDAIHFDGCPVQRHDEAIASMARAVAAAGGQPTHIAINPANVDIARAAGLDVQWLPMDPPTDQHRYSREHSEAEALAWQDPVLVPTPLRTGDPVDAPGWQVTIDANMAEVDKHQVHGAQVPDDFGPTDCRGEPLDIGPATRADLLELDAVPEPVDSAAPLHVHQTPPGHPEGLDEIQRAQLDASIREAERDIRSIETSRGSEGTGHHACEMPYQVDDEPPTPGDQTDER